MLWSRALSLNDELIAGNIPLHTQPVFVLAFAALAV
jgi:hypothetical protein